MNESVSENTISVQRKLRAADEANPACEPLELSYWLFTFPISYSAPVFIGLVKLHLRLLFETQPLMSTDVTLFTVLCVRCGRSNSQGHLGRPCIHPVYKTSQLLPTQVL